MTKYRDIAGVQSSAHPSAEFRYFLFDPADGDFLYFRSVADRDTAAPTIIQSFLDDGWDEDVERVLAGEISHTCEKVNVVERPDVIDDEGLDEDGDYWAEEWSYKCDYDLAALVADKDQEQQP